MTTPLRLLIVSSHPVQYAVPVYRTFEADPRVDLTVAFCSMIGAERRFDAEFGVEVTWDVPMLEGYRHIPMRNRARHPSANAMFGLINPEVWRLIRRGNFDVVISPGYRGVTFWLAFLAARSRRIPFVWSTDSYGLITHQTPGWLRKAKGVLVPWIYGRADMVFCTSTRGVRFFRSLRLRRPKIRLVPYVVDNEFFAIRAAHADRASIRSSWGIDEGQLAVLACGKLVPWKRPMDVLEAVARVPDAVAVFAGDGELKGALQARADELGVQDRVRFLGFVNQTELPSVYAAADVLVMPSSYDAFGLVVNEALACGVPAIVSDAVGSGDDLVRPGETGWVVPVGDVTAIAGHLEEVSSPDVRDRMAGHTRARMQTWGLQDNVDAVVAGCAELVDGT